MELHGKSFEIDNLQLVKQDGISREMCAEFDCTPAIDNGSQLDSGTIHKLGMQYEHLNGQLLAAYEDNSNDAATYVMYNDADVIGYYTIQMSSTKVAKGYRKEHNLVGNSTNTGFSCVDVPFVAVNRKYQNKKYGRVLFLQLLLNVYWQLVPLVGATLITLDALHPAIGFYTKFGFIKYSPTQESKILTPLALDTKQLAKQLNINSDSESEDDAKLRKMLEDSLLFDIEG